MKCPHCKLSLDVLKYIHGVVCVCRSVGVFLAADLSQEELHAAMQKSFALVNSSLSEGMSAAILEVCQGELI